MEDAFAENQRALRELSVTQIFVTSASSQEELRELAGPRLDDKTVAAEAAARVAEAEAEQLREKVAELHTSVHEAHNRTASVAAHHQRQVDIRMTLLDAAQGEALAAKEQAVSEARAQRAAAAAAREELRLCQEQLELERRTHQTDLALVQQERLTQTAALEEEAERSRVSAALLHAELAAIDQLHTATPDLAPPAVVLREIGQWAALVAGSCSVDRGCEPSAGAAAHRAVGAAGGAAGAAMLLSRLERLEGVADAAQARFDALQREHASLRRRYRRLKQGQGLQATPGGAMGGVADGAQGS